MLSILSISLSVWVGDHSTVLWAVNMACWHQPPPLYEPNSNSQVFHPGFSRERHMLLPSPGLSLLLLKQAHLMCFSSKLLLMSMASLGREKLCCWSASFNPLIVKGFRWVSPWSIPVVRWNQPHPVSCSLCYPLPGVPLLSDVEGCHLLWRQPYCFGPSFLRAMEQLTPHLQLHGIQGSLRASAQCWDRLQ